MSCIGKDLGRDRTSKQRITSAKSRSWKRVLYVEECIKIWREIRNCGTSSLYYNNRKATYIFGFSKQTRCHLSNEFVLILLLNFATSFFYHGITFHCYIPDSDSRKLNNQILENSLNLYGSEVWFLISTCTYCLVSQKSFFTTTFQQGFLSWKQNTEKTRRSARNWYVHFPPIFAKQ